MATISKFVEAQRFEARIKDLAEQEATALQVSPKEIVARFATKRAEAIRKLTPEAAALAVAAMTITAEELAAATKTEVPAPPAKPEAPTEPMVGAARGAQQKAG